MSDAERKVRVVLSEVNEEQAAAIEVFLGSAGMEGIGLKVVSIPEPPEFEFVVREKYDWTLEALKGRESFMALEHVRLFRPDNRNIIAHRTLSGRAFLRLVYPKSASTQVASGHHYSMEPKVIYRPETLGLMVQERSEVGLPPIDHSVVSGQGIDWRHTMAVEVGSFVDFWDRYRRNEIDPDFKFGHDEEYHLTELQEKLIELLGR